MNTKLIDRVLVALIVGFAFLMGGIVYKQPTAISGCSYEYPPASGIVWASPEPNITLYMPVVNATASQVTVPRNETDLKSYMELEVLNITESYNDRYNASLLPPRVNMIANGTYNYYLNSQLFILYHAVWGITDNGTSVFLDGKALEQTLKHEFCHYAQEKLCRFQKGGESFCELFAGIDNNCSRYNASDAIYCRPFRASEVDSQGFVDCVFKGCTGYADDGLLDKCYNTSLLLQQRPVLETEENKK